MNIVANLDKINFVVMGSRDFPIIRNIINLINFIFLDINHFQIAIVFGFIHFQIVPFVVTSHRAAYQDFWHFEADDLGQLDFTLILYYFD